MEVKRFNKDQDYLKVINFLSLCYWENKNMTCWLPERVDDLIFKIDTLYREERGLENIFVFR